MPLMQKLMKKWGSRENLEEKNADAKTKADEQSPPEGDDENKKEGEEPGCAEDKVCIKALIGGDETPAEFLASVNNLLSSGWCMVKERNALCKDFTFRDFNAAFGFITRVAIFAEKEGHYPDWSNCRNKVKITLTSEEINRFTEADLKIANFVEDVTKE